MSRAASPSRRSHHRRGLFSARTLLFFVDPEKSCLGATVRQRRIVAKIRRTKHHRRQYIYTTGADSSGSFLRRTCQTLNASKSVRIWTPNRAEVDRCVPGPRARAAVRPNGRVLFSARTLLFLVDPEKSCLGALIPRRGIVAEIRGIVGNTHAPLA